MTIQCQNCNEKITYLIKKTKITTTENILLSNGSSSNKDTTTSNNGRYDDYITANYQCPECHHIIIREKTQIPITELLNKINKKITQTKNEDYTRKPTKKELKEIGSIQYLENAGINFDISMNKIVNKTKNPKYPILAKNAINPELSQIKNTEKYKKYTNMTITQCPKCKHNNIVEKYECKNLNDNAERVECVKCTCTFYAKAKVL